MNETRYTFAVAVVGEEVMDVESLERLVELLVNQKADTHRIAILATTGGPDLQWCQDRGWAIHLVPCLRNRVKQDCEITATADAVIVLGDPARWDRLLRLCREARVPTRVYRERPRLPPPPRYVPEET